MFHCCRNGDSLSGKNAVKTGKRDKNNRRKKGERKMREAITVSGMVLAASPVGEYDKRVVILTRELGKITAFARGARRMKSPLMAVSNPFVFGEFQVYEAVTATPSPEQTSKNIFLTWRRCSPASITSSLPGDWPKYFGREGNDETQMLNLLYVTMNAIRRENRISA